MTMQMLKEADDRQLITITPEWMEQKYNEMNKLLFNGALGSCRFSLFVEGKGSQGGTLGWFRTHKDYGVYGEYVIIGRRVTGVQYYVGDSDYNKFAVTSEDFDYYMNPEIQLNGNYNWTEKAALSTLVHEMCHYRQHLDGFYPGVGTAEYDPRTGNKVVVSFKYSHHGEDFMRIAEAVSKKSNEFFTVERIASAEQMKQMDFTDTMKAKQNALAAKGVHFFKFEFAYPRLSRRGRVCKFGYAIPSETIFQQYLSYAQTYSTDEYKRVVHCVTTDGNIKRHKRVLKVSAAYYCEANSIDEVLPDVRVDQQVDLQLGSAQKLEKPWYIFRMKYKTPYKKGHTQYPWAYYIVEYRNFFQVRNYVNNSQNEFVYADYTEVYDPKIQSLKPNNVKNLSTCYISTTQDIMSNVEQSAPTVIFDNQKQPKQQQQSPLASFLYGDGGNPHLQYQQQQQQQAQQPQPVKRYSFSIPLMKNGVPSGNFTITNATEEEAKQQLRQRFPGWSEEIINSKFQKYAKVV